VTAWSLKTVSTPLGTLYRGREGMWAWLVHRISGIAIFFFLLVHVLDTALVRVAPEAYNQVIGMYHTPIMAIGEAGIVAAVTLHALNGLRIVLLDAVPWGAKYQRRMFYLVLALFVLVMAVFLPIHLTHAFADAAQARAGGFPYFYLAMALAPVPSLVKGRRQPITSNQIRPSRRIPVKRGHGQTLLWLFMRASGILLIVLVAGHLITNLVMGDGVRQINFAFVAGKWASPFWQTWSLLLLVFAMLHGANGVRTVIDDYALKPAPRLILKGLLYLATIVMLALGALVIFTLDPCPPGAPMYLLPDFCAPAPLVYQPSILIVP